MGRGLKRGDLITVAVNGDYGKPRPALIIQSDHLPETDSVLVCQITSVLRDAPVYRYTLPGNEQTGLRHTSQVMIDKITAVRRDRCGAIIGRVSRESLLAISRLLLFVTGVAD